MYSIYKITNNKNEKIYIGKTIKGPVERTGDHFRLARKNSHFLFHKAIREIGEENFNVEILETTENDDEANELEKYYIKKLNTYMPNGYNMTHGGTYTKKGLQKISIKLKNKFNKEKNPFFGKKHSEETKKRMSKSWEQRKEREVGKTFYRFLQNITPEERRKMVLKNKNKISIIGYDYFTGKIIKEWDFANNCEKDLSFNKERKSEFNGGNLTKGLNSFIVYRFENSLISLCKKQDYSEKFIKDRIKKQYKSFLKNLIVKITNKEKKEEKIYEKLSDFFKEYNLVCPITKKQILEKKVLEKEFYKYKNGKKIKVGSFKIEIMLPEYF